MMYMVMFIGGKSAKGDAVNLIELDSEPNMVSLADNCHQSVYFQSEFSSFQVEFILLKHLIHHH